MRGKVTKRSVECLKAGRSAQFLWDDSLSGFGVRVTPAGVGSYVLQWTRGRVPLAALDDRPPRGRPGLPATRARRRCGFAHWWKPATTRLRIVLIPAALRR